MAVPEGRQRSEIRDQKRARGFDHVAEHLAALGVEGGEFAVLLGSDVTAISGKVQRRVGFAVFAIAVGQPFDKLRTSLLIKCAS